MKGASYDLLKRIIDVVVSGIALAVLAPVQVVVALLSERSLGSPVLLGQPRTEKNDGSCDVPVGRGVRASAAICCKRWGCRPACLRLHPSRIKGTSRRSATAWRPPLIREPPCSRMAGIRAGQGPARHPAGRQTGGGFAAGNAPQVGQEGQNDKIFGLIKFRTMLEPDPERELVTDADRRTPFGAFFRPTSFDELATLWNVVKSEMSLVRPRSLLARYLDRCDAEQRCRSPLWKPMHLQPVCAEATIYLNGTGGMFFRRDLSLPSGWMPEEAMVGRVLEAALAFVARTS